MDDDFLVRVGCQIAAELQKQASFNPWHVATSISHRKRLRTARCMHLYSLGTDPTEACGGISCIGKLAELPTTKWPVVVEFALEDGFDLCVWYKFLGSDGKWTRGPKLTLEQRSAKAYRNRRKVPPFSMSFLPFHQEHVTAPPLEDVKESRKVRLHIQLGPDKKSTTVA